MSLRIVIRGYCSPLYDRIAEVFCLPYVLLYYPAVLKLIFVYLNLSKLAKILSHRNTQFLFFFLSKNKGLQFSVPSNYQPRGKVLMWSHVTRVIPLQKPPRCNSAGLIQETRSPGQSFQTRGVRINLAGKLLVSVIHIYTSFQMMPAAVSVYLEK